MDERRERAVAKPSGHGFSLLELMVIVAIVGVVAAVAVPSMTELVRMQRARAEMSRVRQTLVELRNFARATRRCVHVEVTAHGLRGTPYDSCDPALTGPHVDVKDFAFEPEVALAAFSTGDGSLVFNHDGGTEAGEPATLVVTNAVSGEKRRVKVWPAIGTVREER